MLLDLRGLDFMDAAGVRVLDCAYTKASEEGWTFAVLTPASVHGARPRGLARELLQPVQNATCAGSSFSRA